MKCALNISPKDGLSVQNGDEQQLVTATVPLDEATPHVYAPETEVLNLGDSK